MRGIRKAEIVTLGCIGLLTTFFPQDAEAALDGTFTGATSNTQYGPVQVQIIISNGKIISATALQFPNQDFRSQSISAMAIPYLVQETIAANGSNIQGVGGASYTSQGWYDSLTSALAQAAAPQQSTPTPAPVSPTPTPAISSSSASSESAPSTTPDFVTCVPTSAVKHRPISVVPPVISNTSTLTQVTLHTNCGDIVIDTSFANAPLTKQVISTLSSSGYYDGSLCHRLTTSGIFVLQCGDPTGTGSGGPAFTFPDENLPVAAANNYPAGTVAMANSGPNTNGSQFFFVYSDTTLAPAYSIWGKVISGMNILKYVAAQGVQGGGSDGPPIPIAILNVSLTNSSEPILNPTTPTMTSTTSQESAPTSTPTNSIPQTSTQGSLKDIVDAYNACEAALTYTVDLIATISREFSTTNQPNELWEQEVSTFRTLQTQVSDFGVRLQNNVTRNSTEGISLAEPQNLLAKITEYVAGFASFKSKNAFVNNPITNTNNSIKLGFKKNGEKFISSNIVLSTVFPNETLLVVGNKKLSKTILTFKITTNGSGSAVYKTSKNLSGYILTLLRNNIAICKTK